MNFCQGIRISPECVLLLRAGLTQVKTMIQSSSSRRLASDTFAAVMDDGQLTRSNGLDHPSSDIHAKTDNNQGNRRESDADRRDGRGIGGGIRIDCIVRPAHLSESHSR